MSVPITPKQREFLANLAKRPHGITSARIDSRHVVGSSAVCAVRTLEALKRKGLVHVEHEGMLNYWITATPAGMRAVDAIR